MARNKMFYEKYYKISLYVVPVFAILISIFRNVESSNVFKGNLPDPSGISKIFDFIAPLIKSFPVANPVFRTFQETAAIDKIIQDKVSKLRTLLQDDDVKNIEDKLIFDDKNETTIIEFLPKTEYKNNKSLKNDALKTNIKQYKKIREKINEALIKESVSEKTKKLIVKTLDDLIRKLIGSQCKWKRNLRAEGYEEPAVIANRWNEGFHELGNMFYTLLRNDTSDSRRHNEFPKFLNNLQILFTSVSKDIDTISKKYKILCEFVPKNRVSFTKSPDYNALRNSWGKNDDEEEKCQHIIICSNELKEFLRNFYKTLNDTSVSVVRNYVEMFIRDVVPDDENERNTIIELLNIISVKSEAKIKDIFIKETNDLQLDRDKNNDVNINVLSTYVKNTIEKVKDTVKDLLKADLVVSREKIKKVINDDIGVNLDIDLNNLEREFMAKMCSIFSLCNGKYDGRRVLQPNKNNDIYVQMQITLDNDFIDNNNFRRIFNSEDNHNKYYKNKFINVTRTTHDNISTV